MSKRKNNSTGSLQGFILLIVLIGGALFFYQYQQKLPAAETWKQRAEQTIEKVKEAVPNVPVEQLKNKGQSGEKTIASHLEIPVSLKKRNEIKLQRTAFTISYNNFYKTPNWVAWELTRQETTGEEERKNKFLHIIVQYLFQRIGIESKQFC